MAVLHSMGWTTSTIRLQRRSNSLKTWEGRKGLKPCGVALDGWFRFRKAMSRRHRTS